MGGGGRVVGLCGVFWGGCGRRAAQVMQVRADRGGRDYPYPALFTLQPCCAGLLPARPHLGCGGLLPYFSFSFCFPVFLPTFFFLSAQAGTGRGGGEVSFV